MKHLIIVNWDEIAECGEALGFHYNQICSFFQEAGFLAGKINTDMYKDGAYWSKGEKTEFKLILKTFMDKNKLEEFYLTPRHYEV